MSRYSNGAWAGHMCLVCIFAASLCAFEGIFMCIWASFSWPFYGCFVCILVNFVTWWVSKYYITSVYDIMWFIYLRPGRQNTFLPFDTYWINNVTNVYMADQERIKLKKYIIVVYVIWNVVKWQNMETPVSILQESPLARGGPSERLFHIHSVHGYQLRTK